MSVSSSLELRIPDSIEFSIIAAIRLLLSAGWSFNYEGTTCYLPMGDEDDFDWQSEILNDTQLLAVLSQKEDLGELVGVTMTWEKTGIGGGFHFRKNGTVFINLSINRQVIESNLTDVNWYISKIITVLKNGGICVESFVFCEHV